MKLYIVIFNDFPLPVVVANHRIKEVNEPEEDITLTKFQKTFVNNNLPDIFNISTVNNEEKNHKDL
jgi:hypothetical protein